jgi:hypothetical protein
MNWTAWHGSLNVCSWFLDQAKMLKLVLAVNVGFLAAVVVVTLAALHGGVRLGPRSLPRHHFLSKQSIITLAIFLFVLGGKTSF